MKLKTFTDTRTIEEVLGYKIEEMATWTAVHVVTPEEQTEREKLKKPPPDHHFFDIQTGSLDKGKEPERLFMEALFCLYWQFKNAKTYSGNEVYRFTVRDFCQHHEVEKNDLHKITLASYEVWHTYQQAWQADRYRPEILQQIELYLKERPTKKQPKGLEQMFADSNDIQKLVNLLLERKFITKEPDGYHWTGIDHETVKRGKGLQLVALADVCRPLYKGTSYTAKELNQAWTTFFNYKMAAVKWQDGEIKKMDDSYFRLFNFVKHSFSIH